MSRNVFRRLTAALALLVVLGTPLASSAAGPRPESPRAEAWNAPAPFAWLWNLLAGIWEKEGCSIDSYGQCVTSNEQTENGCSIDPFGRCID